MAPPIGRQAEIVASAVGNSEHIPPAEKHTYGVERGAIRAHDPGMATIPGDTVEQGLLEMIERAAALRHLMHCAGDTDWNPEPRTLRGFGELFGDFERLAASILASLDVSALTRSLRHPLEDDDEE